MQFKLTVTEHKLNTRQQSIVSTMATSSIFKSMQYAIIMYV